jgi:outer membrane lipoprotein-sorting protein
VVCGAARAQTLDEILQKALEAVGNVETMRARQSVRMTGAVAAQGMSMPIVIMKKRPSSYRSEVTVQGMSLVQAYDGATAWRIMPFGGSTQPEALPPEQVVFFKEQAQFDSLLLDYAKRGYKFELVGKEALDGKDVFKVKLDAASGVQQTLFFDAATYRIVKTTGKVPTPQGEQEVESLLSDYRDVGGVWLPHSIQSKAGGIPMADVKIEKIEWDVELADSLFKMPTGQ